MSNAVELIKKHEGWRGTAYKDSVGVTTIGWGFNIEHNSLPDHVAELWLAILIEQHKEELETFDWYNDQPQEVKDALLSMHYNLGHNNFLEFSNMIKAFEGDDRDKAADEMLDSKWAEQVGQRAEELADMVRK